VPVAPHEGAHIIARLGQGKLRVVTHCDTLMNQLEDSKRRAVNSVDSDD
jgi:hypothetical protein